MSSRSKVVAALVVAALAATPVFSSAADEVDDARPHAGVSIGGQASRYVNSHTDPNEWFGGANIRFHMGPVLALEGSADYRKSGGNDFYPSQGSLMVYLWPHRFAPYVLGGGTWYFANGSAANKSLFGPHAGAGFEVYIIRHIALDANWRYHWVEELNSGSNYFSRSYQHNGSQWRMGVNFYF